MHDLCSYPFLLGLNRKMDQARLLRMAVVYNEPSIDAVGKVQPEPLTAFGTLLLPILVFTHVALTFYVRCTL